MVHSRDLWTAILPLKIKIFTWQLALDRLPSSTQLAKRLARFDGKCAMCGEDEDASHIFFSCALPICANQWAVLVAEMGAFCLREGPDEILWALEASGCFSVSSM